MRNPRQSGHLPERNRNTRKLRLLATFLAVLAVLLIVFVALVVQKQIFNGGSPQSQTAGTATTANPGGPVCGVTKNSDGSYHFSWLHVDANGDVVDSNNCRVPLLGWNSVGAFQGAGGSLGKADNGSQQPIMHINIVRVAFNSRWYASDVYVPNQRMHYQQWLQKIVSTLEGRGYYVMLDANNAFFEPPCGNDGMGVNITFCPSEDQGRKDYSNPSSPYYQNEGGLELYQPIALEALSELAKVYANDPAVLFDVWNEPGSYIFVVPNSAQNKIPDMNQRINTVRQYDPQSLIFVFESGVKEDLSYQQPNLVFDFHIYPDFKGVSPVTHTPCSTSGSNIPKLQSEFAALRKAGRGIFIGEWGHCYDEPSYNQQILSLAQNYNAGLAYFDAGDLFAKSNGGNSQRQLNANGILVQQDYTTLFAPATSMRSRIMQAH